MAPLPTTARWTQRKLTSVNQSRPRRILVVDDYRPGAEAITETLLIAGYDTQFVLHGAAALRTVTTWIPDIALLDINMPEMDGYAVASHLRKRIETQFTILVAFTSMEESATRAVDSAPGFEAYCQKGNGPGPLLDLLNAMSS